MTATLSPARLDPLIDAPLVGPTTFAIVPDDASQDACTMWRIQQPFWQLHLRGYPLGWAHRRDVFRPDLRQKASRFQLYILCRIGALKPQRKWMEGWIGRMHGGGRTLIYECDDDLFSPFSTEQFVGRVEDAPPREQLELEREACQWVVDRCDGATVTTQYLATTLRRYTNKPIEVVPNAIDAEWFARVLALGQREVPGPTIGWAGGRRPGADLEPMALAWGRIAARYPQVTFVMQGPMHAPIERHVPSGRLHHIPWTTVLEYPLGLLNVDIGCCPLEDRPFNRSKSPIKAWEFALAGAAVVASPTVYRTVIEPGRTGDLATTAEDWEEALVRLLEDEALRRERAAQLKAAVLSRWSLANNVWRWPHAWNRLWRR